jgi:flagellar basal body rod protein FlgF
LGRRRKEEIKIFAATQNGGSLCENAWRLGQPGLHIKANHEEVFQIESTNGLLRHPGKAQTPSGQSTQASAEIHLAAGADPGAKLVTMKSIKRKAIWRI